MIRNLNFFLTVTLFAGGTLAQDTGSRVIPIPQQLFAQPVPDFIGHPAIPDPIQALAVPEDPYMASNGRSNTHADAYQSDTYATAGPLGHAPEVTSTFLAAECGTVTFDTQGRIIAVCVGLRPLVYLLDPVSLTTLARFALPQNGSQGTFGAGGYFFLDQLDRAVIPTRGRDIWRIKEVNSGGRTKLVQDHTCANDLPQMIPSDQSIQSTFPDAHGLLWFTTSGSPSDATQPPTAPGIVGTVSPDPSNSNSCTVKVFTLPPGERINKSFAVDPVPSRGGVFIVSDHQLYRFDAAPDGVPEVTWHQAYDRGTSIKPGQKVQGSGTTPTLMGTEFVAIGDNAEPRIDVNVYRRVAQTSEGNPPICSVPVFEPDKSDTFNSLIATDRSITVENNYGFVGLLSTTFGKTTEPGITRIDVEHDGSGCYTTWTNEQERVPNVVSQASLKTGLEYTYSKDPSPSNAPYTDPWYFTAVDFETGATIYKVLAGTGILYNSYYSAIYLGPDGHTAYVGVLGGLVRIHDTY